MNPFAAGRAVAGVDGCRAGWVAAVMLPGAAPFAAVRASFADLVALLPEDSVIAVDMPIGLPDRAGHGGRGPEASVRPHLGPRRSSVFSVPSRAAVHAGIAETVPVEEWHAAHRRACAVARQTSDPPGAISIQAFALFGKIREIDALLRARPELTRRIFESHPELAFWRLNGERHMALPKKVRGNVHPPGMAERRDLLGRSGAPRVLLDMAPPRGAGEDDLLDAIAMLAIAARLARGEAAPFPDPPGRDAHGIPVAIWA